MVTVYRAHIALAEFDEKKADSIINDGLEKYSDNGAFLFEAAQYFAKKCNYSRALELYELSWQLEEISKPRYTDTLYGIAKIYGIMGNKEKVIRTYDRILKVLTDEWGYNNDDRIVVEVKQEREAVISYQ